MRLFIDATTRAESRTLRLAHHVLKQLEPDTVETVRLYDTEFVLMDEDAINRRTVLAKNKEFSDPIFDLARQFREADSIVIAAPFWDLSFPAVLKRYIESISITGLVFRYSNEGIPIGMCKAKKAYYVTTAGGPIFCPEFGFGYVQSLFRDMYGIPETVLIKAENLDIWGTDVEAVMLKAMEDADKLL